MHCHRACINKNSSHITVDNLWLTEAVLKPSKQSKQTNPNTSTSVTYHLYCYLSQCMSNSVCLWMLVSLDSLCACWSYFSGMSEEETTLSSGPCSLWCRITPLSFRAEFVHCLPRALLGRSSPKWREYCAFHSVSCLADTIQDLNTRLFLPGNLYMAIKMPLGHT